MGKPLERIASFSINHLELDRGLYLSRRDEFDGVVINSYDVRMTAPNQEPPVYTSALHTIEHLLATYYRNSNIKNDVVYVGIMGCLTGMYIIFKGDRSARDVHQLIKDGYEFIVNYSDEEVIPGASAIECGNWLMHDLPMAKFYAKQYIEVLNSRNWDSLDY